MTPAAPILGSDGDRWVVTHHWYVSIDGIIFTVRPGFRSDLASIPWPWRLFWRADDPRWRNAALLHDWLYSHQDDAGRLPGGGSVRSRVDRTFRRMIPSWHRWPMWAWVRLFGGSAWRSYAAVLLCLLTSACVRTSPPADTAPTSSPPAGTQVQASLERLAVLGVWAGGLAIIAAIVFAWLGKPKSAATAGVTAGGLWLGAWIAEQASVHIDMIGYLSLGIATLGGLLYAWGKRRAIRRALGGDLPGSWDDGWGTDQHVGEKWDNEETAILPVVKK